MTNNLTDIVLLDFWCVCVGFSNYYPVKMLLGGLGKNFNYIIN